MVAYDVAGHMGAFNVGPKEKGTGPFFGRVTNKVTINLSFHVVVVLVVEVIIASKGVVAPYHALTGLACSRGTRQQA